VRRFWPTGIRGRLATLIVLSQVPVFLLAVGSVVYFMTEGFRVSRLNSMAHEVREIASAVDSGLEAVRADVRFLASTPPVVGAARAREHGGIDPVDGSREAEWRRRMELIFLGFADARRLYESIRCLDRGGRIVVGVTFADDQARVLDQAAPDSAPALGDIERASAMKEGEIYISPIALHRRGGRIDEPVRPVVIVAAPVTDREGRFQGIVMAEVRFDLLMRPALERPQPDLPPRTDLFIADESGAYLYHSASPSKTWGGDRDLGTGEGVKKDFGSDWKTLLSGGAGIASMAGRTVSTDVSQPWSQPDRYLVVAAAVRSSELTASGTSPAVLDVLLVSAGVFACMVGLVVVLTGRGIVRPLRLLLAAVERFKQGDHAAAVTLDRHDEIGALGAAFNDMAAEIASSQDRLAGEVRDRTTRLEQSRRAALSLLQDADA
jgi:methyl-accepting chemotaxis protein